MSLWLECDSGLSGGEFLVDLVTRKSPVIPDNRDLVVYFGSFHHGLPKDLSTATQIDFGIYESSANNAAAFLEKTISSGITGRVERSTWNRREESNASVTLTDTELNYDLGADDEAQLWCRVSATLSGGEVIPLGEGKFTIGFTAG